MGRGGGFFDWIAHAASDVADVVVSPITAVVGGISKAVSPVVHEVGHVAEAGIKAVSSTVKTGEHVVQKVFTGAEQTTSQILSPIGRGLGAGIHNVGEGLKSIGQGARTGLKDVGEGWGSAESVLPWALGGVAIAYLMIEGTDGSPYSKRRRVI